MFTNLRPAVEEMSLTKTSGVVLEKVCEYLYYNQKHADSKDVSDMDIPPELCLELLIAADYLDGMFLLHKEGRGQFADAAGSLNGTRCASPHHGHVSTLSFEPSEDTMSRPSTECMRSTHCTSAPTRYDDISGHYPRDRLLPEAKWIMS